MQYNLTCTIKCPGAPRHDSDEVRRNCRTKPATVSLPQVMPGKYTRARMVRAALQELAWRNLKTIGKREWLCPRCVQTVMEARSANKEKWG